MTAENQAYAEAIDYLTRLGPRMSGSPAHRALIDHVASELSGIGYDVQRDTHSFERWALEGKELTVHPGGPRGDVSIPLASAWPYSGETPPGGITAPLVLVAGVRKRWRAAAGKIALVPVASLAVPAKLIIGSWDGAPLFDTVTNPVISAELSGIDLKKAREAGVLAVIAVWQGLSDEAARGQYLPFTQGYHGLPAVWAAPSARRALLEAAAGGDSVTLRLAATKTPDATMNTVWAVSPGRGPRARESILVVTHSDGGNAVEENGYIGLLALARDAVASEHDRTVVFICTAGHLRIPAVTAHGQATTAWLEAHPELWRQDAGGLTAAAGLVVEHLGARHFADDPVTGRYGADGSPEPELLYATTPQLVQLARRLWRGAGPGVVRPARPGPMVHLGEGEPLFERDIPAISLVTGPQYLLAETEEDIVDIDVLGRQVDSFRHVLQHLSGAVDRETFGEVKRPGKARKVVAALRVLLFLARDAGRRARSRPVP
ncbi:hypothetical protein VD659_13640 [Herbiconiux sp. 11R-BC]|uniref:hypothetical protein n=1 Tax=Herbiconiux sp. 11R-BC TaxID=3111637 RepID=UPI003C0567BB